MKPVAEPKAAPRGRIQLLSHVPVLGSNVRITPQARYYAISELARRAGVPKDFFKTWKVTESPQSTVLELSNGVEKYISFPHASPKTLAALAAGQSSFVTFPVARAVVTKGRATLANCIVPFVRTEIQNDLPLFYLKDSNHLECAVDLPLSILLTLSCWEDLLNTPRDGHGRVQARNSVASSGGFLDRPIVDEYGLAFEQALGLLYPSWPKSQRKLRIKVSHDADHVGIPFRWRTAIRHTVRTRAVHNSVRDVLSGFTGIEPTELTSVRKIAMTSAHHGLNSAVYWKASPPGPRDSGYDPRHWKVREVVNWLDEVGVESGVHPGYNTFRAPEKLRREVAIVREVLGNRPLGGRQHYLRWSPETWLDWENCGLAYDSSVGFAEETGFKAGTCIPYRPWLFPLNRQADLIEIPLVAMDRTLLAYMGLNKREATENVNSLIDRCGMVGGVFTLLWHNDVFLDPLYRDVYLDLLGSLSGIENYDWQADHAALAG